MLFDGPVECAVKHVQETAGAIFLNHAASIAVADDETIDSVVGIDFRDVPEGGGAANFGHRFGPKMRFR